MFIKYKVIGGKIMDKLIYVDHSATTNIKSEVLEEMLPFLKSNFGNASS